MFRSEKISIDILEKIIQLIGIDFVETKDGLIFIRFEDSQTNSSNTERRTISNTDNTAIETLVNHIHLNEKLNIKSGRSLLKIAKGIGEIWAKRLKREFPERHFRVYLTFNDDVSLRFHQVHECEPNWLNESDWVKDISDGKIVIWDV